MRQTDHRPPDAGRVPSFAAAVRDLYTATVRTTLRTALVMLTAGLDQEARRNAWSATSEGAARARARHEAEVAVRTASVRPVGDGTARAAL